MKYTYDLSEGGSLIITADEQEREWLKELRGPVTEYGGTDRPYLEIEADALEPLICNSELEWIRPEEIAALTDAPILGLRGGYAEDDPKPGEGEAGEGQVTAAWGFMNYALRSFVDDLIETGQAEFTS